MDALDLARERDALLELGRTEAQISRAALVMDDVKWAAIERLLDAARSRLSEPFAAVGMRFAGTLRGCQECAASPLGEHKPGCGIWEAMKTLDLNHIDNRASLSRRETPTGASAHHPEGGK